MFPRARIWCHEGLRLSVSFLEYRYLRPGWETSQTLLRHLRWIGQKDVLGQDVFLIGPPGSLRRDVLLQYCELTQREVAVHPVTRLTARWSTLHCLETPLRVI